jgi:sulfonate transport system ATP-binding protein
MAEPVALARVGKQFRRGQESLPVLNQVDLQVKAGEFVAILGPSGCGKSTLLRLIGGLDQPSAGEIRLGNQVVTRSDPRCAVVFQEPRLFPWKRVGANVAVGSRRLKERPSTETWLERVGLTGFSKSYPFQLSGGMAQRVALARALIGHPEVLLLDEPFASLDALTRLQMQDLLAGVCADIGATAVMVTHDVDEALHLADRIVVMSQRPSTVLDVIEVNRRRPRERGDLSLAPLRSAILRHFGFDLAETPVATESFDTVLAATAARTESAATWHAAAD